METKRQDVIVKNAQLYVETLGTLYYFYRAGTFVDTYI